MHTPVHQAMGSTLAQTAFSYTHCMVLYCSGTSGAIQVPLAVYTIWEVL